MSTTANDPMWLVDPWASCNMSGYIMKRLGKKDYGFTERRISSVKIVARYKCSHLEAQRQFKLMLITRRLLK